MFTESKITYNVLNAFCRGSFRIRGDCYSPYCNTMVGDNTSTHNAFHLCSDSHWTAHIQVRIVGSTTPLL